MSARRVVVSGMGAVSAAGVGVERLWQVVRSGSPQGVKITKFDVSRNNSKVAAAVPAFDPSEYGVQREGHAPWDPSTLYGFVAAREAAEQARVQDLPKDRCGVCVGTAIGGVELMERAYANLVIGESDLEAAPRYPRLRDEELPPGMFWSYSCNSTSVEIASSLGFGGPVTCVSTGCTAGVDALGCALELLRCGDADCMIAGGVDAPITPICVSAFDVIRALTRHNDAPTRASRPFDVGRNGFLLAEGAGFLVLEEREHALERGAPIFGEVLGYGTTCNALHMTTMHEDGAMLARSIELALLDARLSAADIDYINAHGSSTPQNDRAETAAYKTVFRERAYQIPISSTKSVTGHPLGAASALEVIVSLLAIRTSWVPPTANLDEPSPDCDLDYVPNIGRELRLRYVLSNASGFGGLHSAIIVGAP